LLSTLFIKLHPVIILEIKQIHYFESNFNLIQSGKSDQIMSQEEKFTFIIGKLSCSNCTVERVTIFFAVCLALISSFWQL